MTRWIRGRSRVILGCAVVLAACTAKEEAAVRSSAREISDGSGQPSRPNEVGARGSARKIGDEISDGSGQPSRPDVVRSAVARSSVAQDAGMDAVADARTTETAVGVAHGRPPLSDIGDEPIAGLSRLADMDELSAREVDQVVRAHADEFLACYQKELSHTPGMRGKVIVRFEIRDDGTVDADRTSTSSHSTLHNVAVEQCIKSGINHLMFRAKGGRSHVNYPFVFSEDPGLGARSRQP